jgi:hypothetical protein
MCHTKSFFARFRQAQSAQSVSQLSQMVVEPVETTKFLSLGHLKIGCTPSQNPIPASSFAFRLLCFPKKLKT